MRILAAAAAVLLAGTPVMGPPGLNRIYAQPRKTADGPWGTEVTDGAFTYLIMRSGAAVVEYHGTDTEVAVPDMLNELPVSAVGTDAFAGNFHIEKISLPDSITLIGLGAFRGCNNLTEVLHWPAALAGIGRGAFAQCSSLKKLRLPDGIGFIGEDAFSGCTALENILLPESLFDIGPGAFSGCAALRTAVILSHADTGAAAEKYAPFAGCTGLAEIYYGGSRVTLTELVPDAVAGAAQIFGIVPGSEEDTIDVLYCEVPDGVPYVVVPAAVDGLRLAGFGPDALSALSGIPDIYFAGTAVQWAALNKSTGNEDVCRRVVCLQRPLPLQPCWDERTGEVTGLSFPDLAGMPLRGTDLEKADWQEMPADSQEESPDFSADTESEDNRSADWHYSFETADGEPVTQYEALGTGAAVTRTAAEKKQHAEILLLGDVTGTGMLNIGQVTRLSAALLGSEPLAGVYLQAADLNGSGSLDVADLVIETQWLLHAGAQEHDRTT